MAAQVAAPPANALPTVMARYPFFPEKNCYSPAAAAFTLEEISAKDVESGLCPDKFAGNPVYPATGRTLHLWSMGFCRDL
jgi:hypothetical protein